MDLKPQVTVHQCPYCQGLLWEHEGHDDYRLGGVRYSQGHHWIYDFRGPFPVMPVDEPPPRHPHASGISDLSGHLGNLRRCRDRLECATFQSHTSFGQFWRFCVSTVPRVHMDMGGSLGICGEI